MGWVCCWFSTLLCEVFLRVFRFSPLLKTNISKLQFDPGMHWHFWTSSCELLGALWVNKLHFLPIWLLLRLYYYLWCFSILVNYYFQVFFNSNIILYLAKINQNTGADLLEHYRPVRLRRYWSNGHTSSGSLGQTESGPSQTRVSWERKPPGPTCYIKGFCRG